jgi:hypothetical protein
MKTRNRLEFGEANTDTDIYPVEYLKWVEQTLGSSLDDIVVIYSINDDEELWSIENYVIPHGFTYEKVIDYPNDSFEEETGVTFGKDENGYGFSIGHVEVGMLNEVKVVFDQNASPFGLYIKKSDLDKINVV